MSLDLSTTAYSGLGDGQADTVIVNATGAANSAVVNNATGIVSATGLSASVTIFGSDPLNDHLIVNALAGDDAVQASGLGTRIIRLTRFKLIR